MLVIPVKEGEQIDRALKRLKRKFLQTGTLKKLREKKQYLKVLSPTKPGQQIEKKQHRKVWSPT